MNIGIFSGSFNPVHIGHLILANYIAEFTDIDEVWLMITPQNPLKADIGMVDEAIRYKMAESAVAAYRKIKASDFEFQLPRPSYTVNTLQKLREKYPEHRFSLVIGADNWERFSLWKDYRDILDNYPVYVYPRLNSKIDIPAGFGANVTVVDAPVIEISSTFIRDSIKGGKDIRAFLPESVYNYILEKGLYK